MKDTLRKKRKELRTAVLQEECRRKCPLCGADAENGFIVRFWGFEGIICPECYERLDEAE